MTNDKFRDAIEIHFGDRNDIDSINKLGILMRNHRFHGKDIPTQNQLDAAWNHLKNIGVIEKERPVYRKTIVRKKYRHYIPEKHYIIIPKGFKKQQVRDKKTGRIIGWE
jgi:hypothetical protein